MTFDSILAAIQREVLDPIITVIALAAFVLFVYGVFEFVRSADDATKRKTGQMHIFWGLIGLAVLFGARAIVAIIQRLVGG